MGMAIDAERAAPAPRRRRGRASGPAIHPVAVRAVHDVHAALPDLPIVGVGGVADAATALELLLAGADAVQVGTATFADPRCPDPGCSIELETWCRRTRTPHLRELIGTMH